MICRVLGGSAKQLRRLTSRFCYSKLVGFWKLLKLFWNPFRLCVLFLRLNLHCLWSWVIPTAFERHSLGLSWCNGSPFWMLARKLPVDNSIVISSHSPGTRKEIFMQVRGRRENNGRTQNDGKRQKCPTCPRYLPKILRSVIAGLLLRHLPRYYCVITAIFPRYCCVFTAVLLRYPRYFGKVAQFLYF